MVPVMMMIVVNRRMLVATRIVSHVRNHPLNRQNGGEQYRGPSGYARHEAHTGQLINTTGFDPDKCAALRNNP